MVEIDGTIMPSVRGVHKFQVLEFFSVAANIYGSSLWKFLHFILVVPRKLRFCRFLESL
jgi:hypothetical protein